MVYTTHSRNVLVQVENVLSARPHSSFQSIQFSTEVEVVTKMTLTDACTTQLIATPSPFPSLLTSILSLSLSPLRSRPHQEPHPHRLIPQPRRLSHTKPSHELPEKLSTACLQGPQDIASPVLYNEKWNGLHQGGTIAYLPVNGPQVGRPIHHPTDSRQNPAAAPTPISSVPTQERGCGFVLLPRQQPLGDL